MSLSTSTMPISKSQTSLLAISQQVLVTLSPPETLLFSLVRDTSPKTTLRITNTTKEKVAFKVKTTQPSWYFVRPNQQIVDAEQTEEVTIVLVESECNRFLDLVASDQTEKLDKHRFLVQSKIIDEDTFQTISNLSHNLRADEYSKIWDSGNGKDDRKNQKLKVEFRYPTYGTRAGVTTPQNLKSPELISPTSASGTAATLPESVENVRKRISKIDHFPASASINRDSVLSSDSGSNEPLFTELQTIRKKYDAVVEYTVQLTAERDYQSAQLEELRRELSREKARKRAPEGNRGGKVSGGDRTNDKKGQSGFSLFILILFSLIFFLLGRYIKL